MDGLVFFSIFILVAVLVIVFSIKKAKETRRRWRRFAERYDLDFSGESLLEKPAIAGSYQGVSLRIHIEVQGTGKNRHSYTRYIASFNTPLPQGLTITGEGFTDKIVKFFGGQDIQVGIPRVDAALRIKGDDEVEVRRLLHNEAVCNPVMKLVGSYRGVITDGTATIRDSGYADNENILQHKADAVASAVRDIEQALADEPRSSSTIAALAAAAGATNAEPSGAPTQESFADKDGSVMATDQGSTDVFAPDAAPAVDVDLDAALTKLRDGGTSFLERPEIAKRIKGRRLSGSMTVGEVTWTTSFQLSERVRSGHTAVGTMPDGLPVGVSFVKARDAEIKTLKRGDELRFSGSVAYWDDIHSRLLVEAE